MSCGFLSLHSAKQVCAFLITHRASLLVHPGCGSDRAPACYIPHAAWCFSRIRRGRCNPRRHQHYPVAFTEPSHHCARWLQHPVRTYGAYSLLRLLRHQQVLYFNATAFAWPLPQRCGTSGFSTAMIQHLQLLQLRLCGSNTRFLRFSNNIGSSCITITSLQLRFLAMVLRTVRHLWCNPEQYSSCIDHTILCSVTRALLVVSQQSTSHCVVSDKHSVTIATRCVFYATVCVVFYFSSVYAAGPTSAPTSLPTLQ